jgi:membrane protease YdiL (CAAX protease family)
MGFRPLFTDPFRIGQTFTIILYIVIVLIFLFLLYQCVAYAVKPELRTQAWKKLTGTSDLAAAPKDFTVELLLPRSRRERFAWIFVSLAAGVCEEFLFRGIAFAALNDLAPGLSIVLIVLITSVVFGAGHAYQGVSGVARTTAVGIFLGFVYAGTGSLIPVMALHFMMDFSSCFTAPDADAGMEEKKATLAR